ncbi:MAG: aminotransferase class I/II-fold pyridoxal phosphate-dependent enzyme [Oscillochloridaceae bacterium]|nr:aminotransferase class I/II-fold pyridoxal phosphate-dependent enzyme [Chloroflexaceae bacterium]MDW8388857.1 aminotransferase class I/II-fold pyridoxal phosphate-dependent enzyme [Oscillochloridaceae bacterium]
MGPFDPIAHGALDHAELAALGLRAEELLDFSSNINPFGPPAAARAALASLDVAPYPDRSCHWLRVALAARHGCPPESILVGNGANELIHLVARALLRPNDTTLLVGPSYGEYLYASRLAGAHMVELRTRYGEGFRPDLDALTTVISSARPRLTWLCLPNNPTGVDLPAATINALGEACMAYGGLLVLDRAYALLRRHGWGALDELAGAPPGQIHVYSLTKAYALAGLRLGYLIAAPELAARIGAYQPAWSVNSAAQAAGLAALGDDAFLGTTLPRLWAASDALRADLLGLGLDVWRDTLPFMLVRTGDGAATRTALLRRGCVVRDCASFGLPEWVRVAPRHPDDNARLLAAWKESLCPPR